MIIKEIATSITIFLAFFAGIKLGLAEGRNEVKKSIRTVMLENYRGKKTIEETLYSIKLLIYQS